MALQEELDKLVAEGGEIETDSIKVGGVKVVEVKDAKGHVWAVPADDDNIDINEFRNILDIPKREPGFYYQYVDGSRLNEFLTSGFVVVDRDEVGIPALPYDVHGNPLANPNTSHHQVGNLHLVKIPEVLERRMRKRQAAIAAMAKASIEQPRHAGKPVKQINDTSVTVDERQTEVEFVRPRRAEFKET